MKIAILGTRGIPARYGGFETFAEELSTRLVALGHTVVVYRRHSFGESVTQDELYRGVKLRSSATIMHKYLETPVAAITSFWDVLFNPCDVALLCNAANSPFAWLLRLRGIPLAINVDGIERKRAKWNWVGKLWYRAGEICSVLFASRVVADAEVIAEYYRSTYHANPTVIAYGGTAVLREPGPTLKQFGLKSREYILYVARLEPENNALGVVQGYVASEVDIPLVVVGDAPYADAYKAQLHVAANSKVIFTGYQFGESYQELQSNCKIYIQGTEVGGTHPALVEAMAYGNCVVANGTPENVEVLADAGVFYSKNNFEELSQILRSLVSNSDQIEIYRKAAKNRAAKQYQWDVITGKYCELFSELTLI